MADAAEWLESPSLARRLIWTIGIGAVIVLAMDAFLYVRFPDTLGGSLSVWLFLAVIWAASLAETPKRVAVDGYWMRVQYGLGHRDIPLGDVVALDLAPGPSRRTSTLRVALRSTSRILGIALEPPAADALASRLERIGFFVNRTPPPGFRPVPSA